MEKILLFTHITTAVLLSITVLAQEKSAGMGSAVAGSAGGAFYATKRGAAKVLHNASILMALLFVTSAIAYIVV